MLALAQSDFVLGSLSARVTLDLPSLTATVDNTQLEAGSLTELRSALTGAVYSRLHAANPRLDDIPGAIPQDLTESLVELIPHRSVRVTAELHHDDPGLGVHAVVVLQGVKVVIPRSEVTHLDERRVSVAVPSWRTRTTPGFVLALGPHGSPRTDRITRLYVAVPHATAARYLWESTLPALNELRVPYHAKIASSSLGLPRSDAFVIYLETPQVPQVLVALDTLLAENTQVSALDASAFAACIAPGIGLATEPADQRTAYRNLSFGHHRSRVFVDSLIRSHQQGISHDAAWQAECEAANVRPGSPGFNLTDFPHGSP